MKKIISLFIISFLSVLIVTAGETKAQDLTKIIRYDGIIGNPAEGYTGIKIFNTSSKEIIAFRGELTFLNGTNPTIHFKWNKIFSEITLSPNNAYFFSFESKQKKKGLFGNEKTVTKASSILPASIFESYNDFYEFFTSNLSEKEKKDNKMNSMIFEWYTIMKESPDFQVKAPIGTYTITAIMFADGTVLEAAP